MVERPIKKSERQAMGKISDGETTSPEEKDVGQPVKRDPDTSFKGVDTSFKSKDRDKSKEKGKGKGKGKDRDREDKPAAISPALVRGPRPAKIEPPKEEEVIEVLDDDGIAPAEAASEEPAADASETET